MKGYYVDVDGSVISLESMQKEVEENRQISHESLARETSQNLVNRSRKTFFCDWCGKEFLQKKDWRQHIGESHSVQCPYCNLKVRDDYHFLNHIKKERDKCFSKHFSKNLSVISLTAEENLAKKRKLLKTEWCKILAQWETNPNGMKADDFLDVVIFPDQIKDFFQKKEQEAEKINEEMQFQKDFLVSFFTEKKAEVTFSMSYIMEQYHQAGGHFSEIRKKSWEHLGNILAEKKLKILREDNTVTIVNCVSDQEMKENSKKENRKKEIIAEHILNGLRERQRANKRNKRNKRNMKKERRRETDTMPNASENLTGRDNQFANKGDYLFREHGKFGSTPLYDDYDN